MSTDPYSWVVLSGWPFSFFLSFFLLGLFSFSCCFFYHFHLGTGDGRIGQTEKEKRSRDRNTHTHTTKPKTNEKSPEPEVLWVCVCQRVSVCVSVCVVALAWTSLGRCRSEPTATTCVSHWLSRPVGSFRTESTRIEWSHLAGLKANSLKSHPPSPWLAGRNTRHNCPHHMTQSHTSILNTKETWIEFLGVFFWVFFGFFMFLLLGLKK